MSSDFASLSLINPLLRALAEEGYTVPTPIQAKTIPALLAGNDVLGCAQTGTGKTAAFALPLLQRLMESTAAKGAAHPVTHPTTKPLAARPSVSMHPAARGAGHSHTQSHAAPASSVAPPRVLVLAPTRELATQIVDSFETYGRYTLLKTVAIYGGVSQFHQVKALQRGVDILVATPGRLMDLMQQRLVRLDGIKALVLDEADRMLDMGFIEPIRRIVAALPKPRHTLLFSATMPKEIMHLADALLTNPVKVSVTPVSSTVLKIEQSLFHVDRPRKQMLLEHLLESEKATRTVVFTKTKHGADRVARKLTQSGFSADAIHGNKAQNRRTRTLDRFKNGSLKVLVATDVAARGLDVDGVSHVINFDLPMEPEAYVHRIGRTGRAGASGIAISFCDRDEVGLLRQIERLTKSRVPERDVPAMTARPELVRQESEEAERDAERPVRGSRHASHGGSRGGSTSHRSTHAPSASPVKKKAHRGQESSRGSHKPAAKSAGSAASHATTSHATAQHRHPTGIARRGQSSGRSR